MTKLSHLYALRDADNDDIAWILELAVQLAEVTVPPIRGAWGQAAQEFVRTSVSELLKYRGGLIRFLVAIDRADNSRVGYLLLNTNHESPLDDREMYIEDMGVVSEYLGKRVGHFLTDEAARIAGEEGVDYLGAHISGANRRALLAALGNGFELESYRIARPCTDKAAEQTKDSERALERQAEAEKLRRVLLARKRRREQRRKARRGKDD